MTKVSEILIRNAQEEDLKAIHQIFNEILLTSTATFEEKPYEIEEWAETYKSKRKNKFPFIVAEVGSQVVGYGTYGLFRRASGYKITVEHSLHVASDFRGRGIGKILLGELISRAEFAEIQNMIAGIDADNISSIKLHQRFGFQQVGVLQNIASKFSRKLTLILMQKNLL